MDRRQVERRLERAFRSAPLRYGEAQVRERKKPFGLAQTILPAGNRSPTETAVTATSLRSWSSSGSGRDGWFSLAHAAALVKGSRFAPCRARVSR